MKHVVSFSGGVGSWLAAKRVVAKHGREDVTLLFADTLIEDPDLYRFLDEAAADVGARLVRIADGRTPFEVFRDVGALSHRIDACSKLLKRDMMDRWLLNNCDSSVTTVYVGIDWTEEHRFTRLAARRRLDGWNYAAPLCEAPFLSKHQMFEALSAAGIRRPRLYELGFGHNNCGGGCIKAGQAHWALLLRTLPDVYARWETEEDRMRSLVGDDAYILRDRTGGVTKGVTLRAFRERLQTGQCFDLFEWGGCGCFVDEPAEVG